jgi:hypothetical protein
MARDVEARIDELYGLPLDRFIPERDALAKELRATGDREAAELVKAQRKPVVATWALNRLAREAKGIAELAAVGVVSGRHSGRSRRGHRTAPHGHRGTPRDRRAPAGARALSARH